MQFLLGNPGLGRRSVHGQQGGNSREGLLHIGQGAFAAEDDPDQEADPKVW